MKGGNQQWFSGTVTEVRKSTNAKFPYHVSFDDGDKQWVAQDDDFGFETLTLSICINW